MKFKTPEMETQYASNQVRPKTKLLMQMIDLFMRLAFGVDMLVTDLYRTQEGQDAIYGEDENYKRKKWFSPHQFGLAFDISTKFLKKEQIIILQRVADFIPYAPGSKFKTWVYHDVGMGMHLHFQVKE